LDFLNAVRKKLVRHGLVHDWNNPVFAAGDRSVDIEGISHMARDNWESGIIVVGAYLISSENLIRRIKTASRETWAAILETSWLGLSAAFFWALSPILFVSV